MCSLLILKIPYVIRYCGGSQPQKATTSSVKFPKTKEKAINLNEEEAGRASTPVLATPHLHSPTRQAGLRQGPL